MSPPWVYTEHLPGASSWLMSFMSIKNSFNTIYGSELDRRRVVRADEDDVVTICKAGNAVAVFPLLS